MQRLFFQPDDNHTHLNTYGHRWRQKTQVLIAVGTFRTCPQMQLARSYSLMLDNLVVNGKTSNSTVPMMFQVEKKSNIEADSWKTVGNRRVGSILASRSDSFFNAKIGLIRMLTNNNEEGDSRSFSTQGESSMLEELEMKSNLNLRQTVEGDNLAGTSHSST